MGVRNPQEILEHSTVVATRAEVQAAVERMADEINAHFRDRPVILLIVMTGAVMPAAWLAARLGMPLQMDFIHVTRYDGDTEGGELRFRVPPRIELKGQDVLIVEDIFDVGLTLQAIVRHCREQGAASVRRSSKLPRRSPLTELAGGAPRIRRSSFSRACSPSGSASWKKGRSMF